MEKNSTIQWENIQRFDSEEGNVAKFVFEKDIKDGQRPAVVEAVLYRYPISTSAPDVSYEAIFDVSKRVDTVGLQFFVHESTNEARAKLIPTKIMSLERIAETGEAWHKTTGRKPFFNQGIYTKIPNFMTM